MINCDCLPDKSSSLSTNNSFNCYYTLSLHKSAWLKYFSCILRFHVMKKIFIFIFIAHTYLWVVSFNQFKWNFIFSQIDYPDMHPPLHVRVPAGRNHSTSSRSTLDSVAEVDSSSSEVSMITFHLAGVLQWL